MQDLVGDLLTLAQLEGSPRPPADRWVSVAELLQRAQADALALSAGRHDAAASTAATTPQIAGSETELHSAVGNLVNNAVRYTPPGGRIDVPWRWRDDGGGELARQRHRHRHRARAPAAADRALLPRRRQPLARHRRHRARPVDRQARGAAPRRRDRHPERAGQGLHLQAAVAGRRGCAHVAPALQPDAGRRGVVLIAAAQRAGVAPVDRGQVRCGRSAGVRAPRASSPAGSRPRGVAPARPAPGSCSASARRRGARRPCSGPKYSSAATSAGAWPGAAMQAGRHMARDALDHRTRCCARSPAAAGHSVISSSQHRATPPAGSTRLFHSASRWRPVRQRTSQIQASVPSSASASASSENCGVKPGASGPRWPPAWPARRSAPTA